MNMYSVQVVVCVLHRYGVHVVLQPSVEVHNGPIKTGCHMLVSGPDFIVCVCVTAIAKSLSSDACRE